MVRANQPSQVSENIASTPPSGLRRMDVRRHTLPNGRTIIALPGHLDTADKRGAGEVRPFPDHLKPKRLIKSESFRRSEAPKIDFPLGDE